MEYVSVTNPVWSNAAHTSIDCTVVFVLTPETVAVPAVEATEDTPGSPEIVGVPAVLSDPWPFTATPNDVENHCQEIFARAIAGDFGAIGTYVAPPPIIPQVITRRQCAKQMMIMRLITPAEALAMTKAGDCPAMVMALINQLPAEVQIPAQIDFAAETYLRSNQLLETLMAAAGKNSSEVDQFFIAASAL